MNWGPEDRMIIPAYILSVNSFQANDRTSSKGSLGLSDSKMSTATLFTAPGTNNFKLNELFTGCSSVGASKWRR